jgi:glycosidase
MLKFWRQGAALACLLLSYAGLAAQILTVDPVFPSVDDTVTILYDATQGNAALLGVAPVYAHTGVITSQSTSPSDWRYVKSAWGVADPNVLMQNLGNNLHRIKYHIRSYYGIPQSETVLKLAFVFRNANGSIVGRDTDGSDIFYDVYGGSGLETAFLTPESGRILAQGDTFSVKAASSAPSTLTLFVNNVQVAQATNAKKITHLISAGPEGSYWIKLRAESGANVKTDSIYYVVRGAVTTAAPPAGLQEGITYVDGQTVRLALYAPRKEFVYVLGDFNDWRPNPAYFMKRSPDSALWWLEINGLMPGQEYAFQYLVDGSINIADPYADKVLDPWNDGFIPAVTYPNLKPYPAGKASGIVSVLQTNQQPYAWQNNSFSRPANRDLIVYELLVRDFIARHDYQTLIDSLDYLQRLGVNAIELMPVMEFEGNSSWGYNPSFFFAPDKYYGTKNDLKAFIDSCHGRGMAVILDMVLNHAFGQNPLVRLYWDGANNRPAADNPWFNVEATHPFNVGYDFNHESPDTRRFTDRVLAYWVQEYRFDGYRMDLSKGFTSVNYGGNVGAWSQYDASRVANWKRIYDQFRTVDPTAYLILEHFAANNEEKELAEYGMMLWGKHVFNYNEATMGYLPNSNFSGISYLQRNWNVPHLVGYMESHDEERLMYKNLTFGNGNASYSVKNLSTALARMEAAGAFFFTIPGPKMIWQFGEVGYDVSIDFNGRTGEKPIRWNYFTDGGPRRRVYNVWSALLELRHKEPAAFQTSNFSLDLSAAIKRISLNDPSMRVHVIGNFDIVPQTGPANFPQAGRWYDYFSGDSLTVSNTAQSFTLVPGEYRVYTTRRQSKPNLAVSAEEELAVQSFSLYPNPARGQVQIEWVATRPEQVSLDVLDLQGRVVARLLAGEALGMGAFQYTWDGMNAQGQQAAAGLYVLRLQGGSRALSRRFLYQP